MPQYSIIRMKKNKLILLFILPFLSIMTFACNCNPGGTIEANVVAANAILRVRVLSINYSNKLDSLNVVVEGDPKNTFAKYWNFYVKIYTVIVEETYKGKMSSDTVRVITGMNGASCGLVMQIGDIFLLYGTTKDYQGFSSVQRKATDGKVVWANNCSRSMKFFEGEDEPEIFLELKAVQEVIEKMSYRE